jgi:DNA-binding response OmpR family regulator
MTSVPTILVVDDETAIVTLITEVLADEGYVVEAVFDGNSALRAIAEQRPALILLDNMMPGLSGLEVLRRLRSGPDLIPPVIMMSAATSAHDSLNHGAAAFLAKPFAIDALLTLVAHTLPPPIQEANAQLAVEPNQ